MELITPDAMMKEAKQQEFAERCKKAQEEIQKIFKKYQLALVPIIEMRDMKEPMLIVPPSGTKID
jgi:predicted nucleic acid-binding protein